MVRRASSANAGLPISAPHELAYEIPTSTFQGLASLITTTQRDIIFKPYTTRNGRLPPLNSH